MRLRFVCNAHKRQAKLAINPFSINTSPHPRIVSRCPLHRTATIRNTPSNRRDRAPNRKGPRLLAYRLDQCAREEDNRSGEQFPGRWQHPEPCARHWHSAAAIAPSVRPSWHGDGGGGSVCSSRCPVECSARCVCGRQEDAQVLGFSRQHSTAAQGLFAGKHTLFRFSFRIRTFSNALFFYYT